MPLQPHLRGGTSSLKYGGILSWGVSCALAMKQPVTSFCSGGKCHEQENVPAPDLVPRLGTSVSLTLRPHQLLGQNDQASNMFAPAEVASAPHAILREPFRQLRRLLNL